MNFKNIYSILPLSKDDGLLYWRERILFALLGTGLFLSLFAIIPVAFLAIREKVWFLAIIDIIVFISFLIIILKQNIRYRDRALATLLMSYALGVIIIAEAGLYSGGPAWLFAFATVSGLLLGLKAAIFAILLNLLTLTSIAILIILGKFGGALTLFISSERGIAAGASFILLNAATAISAAILVRGLEITAKKQADSSASLEEERTHLLYAKEQLKNEIIERLKSEEKLRKSERKYRLMTEKIHDVIWTMNMSLKFTYVSPAIKKLQGFQADELLSLSIEKILTPESYEKVLNLLNEQLISSEKSNNFDVSRMVELELIRKDGQTVWAEVTASFLLDSKNKPTGILGVARDITERKKAQLEKEELQSKLSGSMKMQAIGTLAGGVAHDLNNVLSGIVSYPDLILMDLPDDSPLKDQIKIIKESGEKAAAIVQDLLTLARRGVSVTEIVNLNDILSEYLKSPEFEKLKLDHSSVEVEVRYDPLLLNNIGSPVHLSKTIMNLVSNAAEAMPNGGKIEITTENRYIDQPIQGYDDIIEGEYGLLTIKDTGIGISEDEINRVFEPFFTKKVMGRSGTGLGMAVVWGTVKDHNGYIHVDSIIGKGTVFRVYFPATRKQKLEDNKPNSHDNYRGCGESILVVDDIKEQRNIANIILSKLGYKVKTLDSGEEAVKYIKQNRPDLVILDMIMKPGIDGLETYEKIVSIQPGQKAIIASGFSETDRVREAQRLGAGPYVKKPYTIEKIGLAVKTELSKPQMAA